MPRARPIKELTGNRPRDRAAARRYFSLSRPEPSPAARNEHARRAAFNPPPNSRSEPRQASCPATSLTSPQLRVFPRDPALGRLKASCENAKNRGARYHRARRHKGGSLGQATLCNAGTLISAVINFAGFEPGRLSPRPLPILRKFDRILEDGDCARLGSDALGFLLRRRSVISW